MLTPILMPIAMAMEIHPVHLGLVMVLNLMLGLITPPVGLCLFAVSEVAKISPVVLMRALIPFFFPLLGVLLLITLVPEIVLVIPQALGFIR